MHVDKTQENNKIISSVQYRN